MSLGWRACAEVYALVCADHCVQHATRILQCHPEFCREFVKTRHLNALLLIRNHEIIPVNVGDHDAVY